MFFAAPISTGFNTADIENFKKVIKIIWIFDLLISLNKGFYKFGLIVLDRNQIFKNYCFKQFF